MAETTVTIESTLAALVEGKRYATLRDILITQREVLSAMLYAKGETGSPAGVLMTRNGVSRREPARPLPERELWFERVWKRYREEQALTSR